MKKLLALAVAATVLLGSISAFALRIQIPEDADTVMGVFYVLEDSISGNGFSMISEDGVWIINVTDETSVAFEAPIPVCDDCDEYTWFARDVLLGRTLAEILHGRNLFVASRFSLGAGNELVGEALSITIMFETAVHLDGDYIGIMTLLDYIDDWSGDWEFFGFNSYEHMVNQGRSLELVELFRAEFPTDEVSNIIWPDWFGGLYLNDIGNLVIQVVDNDGAREQAVAALGAIVDLSEIIFENVEFSEMYLMSILDSLFDLWNNQDCDVAANVTGFGLDTMNNRVSIWLRSYNEAEIARFRETILDSTAISFEQGHDIFLDTLWPEPEITVILDGEVMQFEVPPMMIEDRTMVPFRAIFEALGADVEWYETPQMVVAERVDVHHDTITLQIGNNEMRVKTRYLWIGMPYDEPRPAVYSSEIDVNLDVPPMIVNNRTLVPLRAVSEALGADVDWCQDTQTVTITSDAPAKFQLNSATAWQIGLADELVSEYAAYVEFVEFEEWDGEPHQRIAIVANQTPMRDFQWIEVGVNDDAEDWQDWFYVRSVLYEAGDLEPQTPFVVTWMPWGTLPHRGISFIDPLGVRRNFWLNTNNAYPYDGPPSMFMMMEFGAE